MGGLTKRKPPWNTPAEKRNGEFDWMAPGWGPAVRYLIGDAEDLVEEEEGLKLVHPTFWPWRKVQRAPLQARGHLAATVPTTAP